MMCERRLSGMRLAGGGVRREHQVRIGELDALLVAAGSSVSPKQPFGYADENDAADHERYRQH
jgi:hypothetical protein